MKILKNEETGLLALATDEGKLVTEYVYDRLIGPNQFGLYKAYKGKPKSEEEEVGFINNTGKEVVPVNWFFDGYDKETEYDENGYCFVCESNDNHGEYGNFYNALYDVNGNVIFKNPNIFSHKTAFGNYVLDKCCALPTKTNYGLFISKTGKIVEPVYTDIGYFNKYGYALVRQENRCGIIDAEGNEALSCNYRQIIGLPPTKEELDLDDFDNFEEYLKGWDPYNSFFFVHSFNGSWGVSSFKSDVIKFKYCAFGPIIKGEYLPVCDRKTRKWGIIDTNLELIVSCQYNQYDLPIEDLTIYAYLAEFNKPTFDTGSARKFR